MGILFDIIREDGNTVDRAGSRLAATSPESYYILRGLAELADSIRGTDSLFTGKGPEATEE